MRNVLVTLGGVALALGAVLSAACGSVVAAAGVDAGPDATTEPDAGADAADDTAFGPAPDAQPAQDASYDAPSWPTDAACVDGGLTGDDAGATFSCAGGACAAGSEYCGRFAAGRIVPFFYPQPGCHPLPCDCAPARGCGCLGALPTYCSCAADNGAITVTCVLP